MDFFCTVLLDSSLQEVHSYFQDTDSSFLELDSFFLEMGVHFSLLKVKSFCTENDF